MVAASHMREARRAVQHLAAMEPDGPPVVSLYLDTKWSDEHQRERARLFLQGKAARLREAWRGTAYANDVARSLDHLERRVTTDIIEQGDPNEVDWDGYAFFVSHGRGLWVGLRTRLRLENELEVEERPRLLQVARVLADHSPAFVVLLDGRWVRLFEVALGAVIMEAEMEQYLPDRVDAGDRGPFAMRWPSRAGPAALARGGGLSQMRYQRHVRDHLEHNLKNAAALLERLSSHETGAPVVLCGEEELRGLFRRVISDPLHRRVAHEMRLDSRAPRHLAVALAARALEKVNEERRCREVDEAIGRAMGSDLAVVGTEDTMLALHESRLYALYLDVTEDLGRGWRCRSCAAFGRKAEIGCPFCGGRTMSIDLAEELARRAVLDETRLVIVSGHTRLRHYRGLAGTLRRGLSPTAPGVGYAGHEPLPPA